MEKQPAREKKGKELGLQEARSSQSEIQPEALDTLRTLRLPA